MAGAFTMYSEMSLTLYLDANDIYNFLGYILNLFSVAFIYPALDSIFVRRSKHSVQQYSFPEDVLEMFQRVGQNKELLDELMELFFQDYHRDMASLKESLENKDAPTLAFVAHGLKGELGNLGMKSAYEIAIQMERMAKESRLEEAASLATALEYEVKRLENFFSTPGWQKHL